MGSSGRRSLCRLNGSIFHRLVTVAHVPNKELTRRAAVDATSISSSVVGCVVRNSFAVGSNDMFCRAIFIIVIRTAASV